MATTIITPPARLSFSDNPIDVKLSSDKLVETPPQFPYMEWVLVPAGPTAADQLIWNITDPETGLGESLIIVAAVSPDDTGSQIPTNPSVDPADDYAVRILEFLKKYAYLNTWYDVVITASSASSATIRFTAKTADAGLAFSPLLGSLDNITITTDDTATAAVYRSAFRLVIFLFVEKTLYQNDWDRITIDAYRDQDDFFHFDFSKFLSPYCNAVAPLPPYTLVAPNFHRHQAQKRYYFQRSELYADTGELVPSYKSLKVDFPRYVAFLGGLNQERFADLDFLGDHPTHQRLLSWYPDGKHCSPDQPEFINWINTTGEAVYAGLRVTVNFTDGTSTDIEPVPADTNHRVEQDEVICFPAGYNQLSLAAVDPTKIVCDWTAKVFGTTTAAGTDIAESATRSYVLDQNCYLQERHIIFTNSLGGWETMRCTGTQTEKLNIEKLQYKKALRPGYQASDGHTANITISASGNHTLSSGWKTEKEMRVLQDILFSPHVFLRLQNRYQKIVVLNSEVQTHEDLRNMQALRLNYRPSFDAVRYTENVSGL